MNKEEKIELILARIKGIPQTRHFFRVYDNTGDKKVLVNEFEVRRLSENLEIEIISDRSQVDKEYLEK